jgi:hypothetical protein
MSNRADTGLPLKAHLTPAKSTFFRSSNAQNAELFSVKVRSGRRGPKPLGLPYCTDSRAKQQTLIWGKGSGSRGEIIP